MNCIKTSTFRSMSHRQLRFIGSNLRMWPFAIGNPTFTYWSFSKFFKLTESFLLWLSLRDLFKYLFFIILETHKERSIRLMIIWIVAMIYLRASCINSSITSSSSFLSLWFCKLLNYSESLWIFELYSLNCHSQFVS